MKNLLPRFIQKQLLNGEASRALHGTFEAHSMFVDISGFTPMTEQLMREGKEGAEILSVEINRLFGMLIEAVQNRGGMITGFAGDAFTALFQAENPLQAAEAAREVQDVFARAGQASTRFGDFHLSVKVGLSSGQVEWGIVGSEPIHAGEALAAASGESGDPAELLDPAKRLAWYFRGPAIDGCAASEHHCERGDIVLDERILSRFSEAERPDTTPIAVSDSAADADSAQTGYHRLNQIEARTTEGVAAALSFLHRTEEEEGIRREIADRFFPATILDYSQAGEFRAIASVFVSFVPPAEYADLNEFAATVQTCAARYDGYFNSLDFGDKGGTILLVFGAPVSHEDDPTRAADFAIELQSMFGDRIRVGLTTGTAFAGIVGSALRCTYTVNGDVVNLSARVMMSAVFGEVWLSSEARELIGEEYLVESRGEREFKGKSEAIEIFALNGKGERSFAAFDETAFVGRSGALSQLEEQLAVIRAQNFGGLTRILGDAGSGKSRLLHELYLRHRGEIDFIFTHADGVLRRSMNPFTAFFAAFFGVHPGVQESDDRGARRAAVDASLNELIEGVRAAVPDSDHADHIQHIAAELERTASMFAAMVDADISGTLYERLDAQGRYENTLIAVKNWFHARALLRPTVLVLENLQWLDADSRAVIEDILRHVDADHLGLGVIVTSRYFDDGSRPALGIDASHLTARDLELQALTPDAVHSIAAARLPAAPGPGLLEFIQERTGGNPYFIEEFCTYLTHRDLVAPDENGELRLRPELLTDDSTDLPASINALVVSRIDRLSTDLKAAVQAAAVLGQKFEVSVLAHLLDLDAGESKLEDLLAEGEREQIWSDDSEHGAGVLNAGAEAGVAAQMRSFQNALVQEAAYEMQLRDRLRGLHEKAAHFLAGIHGENEIHAADIAFHYGRAENQDRARRYYELAAEYAHSNYKTEKAFEFYDQLESYARDDAERLGVMTRRARLLELLGQWPGALELLERALALAEGGADRKAVGRLKTNLGEIHQKQGEFDRASTLLQEAVGIAEAEEDVQGLGEAHSTLGRTYWSLGQYDNALECYAEGKAAREQTNDRRGYALNLYYTGVVHRDRNEYDRAMQNYRESLEIFENELGDRRYATYPMYDIAVIYQYQGRLDEAREFFERTHALYEEMGYRSGISAALLNLGVIESRQGRYEAALDHYRHSLEHAEDLGEQLAVAYALFSIGTAHYQQQNYNETIRWFEKSFVVMKEIGAKGYYGYVLAYLCCTLARQGHTAKALNAGLQHLKNIKGLGGSDVENGRTHLGIALALAGLGEQKPGAKTAELIQKIGALTGLPPRPDAYFEFAVDSARKAAYVMTLVPALREYGVFLAQKTARAPWFADRAAECLREAHQLCESSGMAGERSRVAADAARLEISLNAVD
ncbi:MAG: tetratricopeptide repeat protein [bacterium]|nr:tetratricopeptide repeat protein [bacterium]